MPVWMTHALHAKLLYFPLPESSLALLTSFFLHLAVLSLERAELEVHVLLRGKGRSQHFVKNLENEAENLCSSSALTWCSHAHPTPQPHRFKSVGTSQSPLHIFERFELIPFPSH